MTDNSDAQLHFLDYWNVLRSRIWLILLTFLLVLIGALVVSYLLPQKYYSKVIVEVKETTPALAVFGGPGFNFDGVDARFTQTQFEILQHKEVLYPVVRELNLQQKWSTDNAPVDVNVAYNKLRYMMELKEMRNTNLIEIGMWSEDKEEAAELANSVADAYEDRRVAYYMQIKSGALRQLQEELDLQQDKVIEARRKYDILRQELSIDDIGSDANKEITDPAINTQMELTQTISVQEQKVSAIKRRLETLENWDGDISSSLSYMGLADDIVSRTIPLYQDAVYSVTRMRNEGLGPKHPSMLALNANIAQYRDTINKQVQNLISSTRALIINEENTLNDLKLQKEKLSEDIRTQKVQSTAYVRAKTDYNREEEILSAAKQRYTTEAMQTAIPFVPMIVHERAEPAAYATKPNRRLNILLGVLIGSVFSVFLAFFIEYLDTSVKTLEDVESALQIPVLAVIPKGVSVLSSQAADTPDAEAYRILRTNIEFNRRNAEDNAITIVSGGAGEGKSTTLFNLAYTFAQGGYNVLVVDADLRRPSQHYFFNVDNSLGLTDYLTSDLNLEDVIVRTSLENLSFLPSGHLPKDAVGILNSQRMSDLIQELKSHFDLVFFDSPPILGVSDAAVLASEVDLTIMVVQHRRFPKSMLQRVKQSVQNVGGTLLGVVLNNVDIKNDRSYDYYTAYYDYYYSKKSTPGSKKATRPAETSKPGALAGAGTTKPGSSNSDQY